MPMPMPSFAAEASLYRPTQHYSVAANWTAPAHGRVVPAQLPPCGTGTYVDCHSGVLPGCTTNCVQRCQTPTGAIIQECCPADRCGTPGDCCKQVCCEVKVV